MKININEDVRVVLTPEGQEVWYRHCRNTGEDEYRPGSELVLPFYVLLTVFGPRMYCGPFVNGDVHRVKA